MLLTLCPEECPVDFDLVEEEPDEQEDVDFELPEDDEDFEPPLPPFEPPPVLFFGGIFSPVNYVAFTVTFTALTL